MGQLSRFLQVGAIGFAIDAGLLWFLVYLMDVEPVLGRLISFVATIMVTYVLNARYTFNVSPRKSSASRYGFIQCLGALLNFGSYTWLVTTAEVEPMIALIVGSALGSTHNFLMMKAFVFKDTDPPTG